MNTVDLVILGVLAYFFLKGFRTGALRQLAGLLGVVVALILAVRNMNAVSVPMSYYLGISPKLAVFLSALAIFLLVLGLFLLVAKALRKMLELATLGWVDRLGGGVFGALKGAIILSILALMISLLPLGDRVEAEMNRSALFNPIRKVGPAVFNGIVRLAPAAGNFYDELQESLKQKSGDLTRDALEWLSHLQGGNHVPADSTGSEW